MPFKSDKQRKMMYAAAEGKSDKMSPQSAKRFISHSGGKLKKTFEDRARNSKKR